MKQNKKRYKQHMKLENKAETDMNIIRTSWNRQQTNDINSMRYQQIDINSIIILQKQKRYKQYTNIMIQNNDINSTRII